MIDPKALKEFIDSRLEGTPYFLVDVVVSPANDITVEIDSESGVDIDECMRLTAEIEKAFDRDAEDYSLEVGSAGLTSPFKVKRQWLKNVGNEVEVLAADGKKYKGLLSDAGETSFTVEVPTKVKPEGAKRPVVENVPHTFDYDKVKYTKYLLDF